MFILKRLRVGSFAQFNARTLKSMSFLRTSGVFISKKVKMNYLAGKSDHSSSLVTIKLLRISLQLSLDGWIIGMYRNDITKFHGEEVLPFSAQEGHRDNEDEHYTSFDNNRQQKSFDLACQIFSDEQSPWTHPSPYEPAFSFAGPRYLIKNFNPLTFLEIKRS